MMRARMALKLADRNSGMTDMDRLSTIYWALSSTLWHGVDGAVVELGCNAGYTTVWLEQIIADFAPGRPLHAFDSFEGLPDPGPEDDYLRRGDCATTREALEKNFAYWGLRPPTIHEGWFSDTLPHAEIDQIAFAYLDGDFYESILCSLEYVYPRLAPGGIVLVDDYCDLDANPRAWDGLPGVKKACDDFLSGKEELVEVLAATGDLSMSALRRARP